ncbi:hypothetical protein PIB30_116051, partial [Stylosanthes scabra]|nr:hypothetical protein [Stylosanthes scabra]
RVLEKQATSRTFKWLIAPTISKLQRNLEPSLSNQIAMMFKQEVMVIGDITSTMEDLVKTLIVN